MITSMDRTRRCIFAFRVLFLLLLIINFHMCCLAEGQNQPFTSTGVATIPTSLATDQSALVALKAHITSDLYGIITSHWTNSSSICTWIGVICGSRHHRVVALNISSMAVVGTIPPHLGNLSFLVSLDLQYNFFGGALPYELSKLRRLRDFSIGMNNFTGEIPQWLGSLPKLETLTLRYNSFQGSIPTCISNLSNLQVLDFSFNSLEGNIPNELGHLGSLQFLDLRNNSLSGPLPLAIFNLSSLRVMSLTFNALDGSLPMDICRNLPFLETIHLSMNKISGQIPTNLSECSVLKSVGMYGNFFSGHIPKEICKLQSIQNLFLGQNILSGVIPQDIGDLQNLIRFGIERNQIHGTVPPSIFNLSSLQELGLGQNKLTGSLPRDVGNLTMLKTLDLTENRFTGDLPQEIGHLRQLEFLAADLNNFTCSTSHDLFNISTLRLLSLSETRLAGHLPASFCNRLPLLEELYLEQSNLTGAIPDTISNCSQLRIVSLAGNQFTGSIPHSFGDLTFLEQLHLFQNNLQIESDSSELSFITPLTNCRFLKQITISINPLGGIVPSTIGNLSRSLELFQAQSCKIKGSIPPEIGNLSSLARLEFQTNELTGEIPHTVKHLHMLQLLILDDNKMIGSIPKALCNLHMLSELSLSSNQLSGPIPDCLGNATSLRHLRVRSNMLNSSIPSSIWRLNNFLELDLSTNSFSGFIPAEISDLSIANIINLSVNQFSGRIPDTIGKLENLGQLLLQNNTLWGSIPISMGSMVNLETLDLSHNNLSGTIPTSLQALRFLSNFNVSFNALTGEIPTNGSFKNFTAESFMGNAALCGIPKFHVLPCPRVSKSVSRRNKVRPALFVLAGVIAGIAVIALTIIFIIRCRRKEHNATDGPDALMPIVPERVSYYEILRATQQFDERNLLGNGSFGSVYKGTFSDGKICAIKVFNLQIEAAFKSFDVECEVLRGIRHRNLTKVLGSCSNGEFKALVLEYMPNGSLEKWLYTHNYSADVEQRLNIMIDVASALEYLHHGYSAPIVHCDLKPSNVLLDANMVAHVSDFGIAKLLGEGESIMHTNTLATLGYIAPEYGLEGLVSTSCDVYSYGILLMETFTRKRPSDEMFVGDWSLKSWVESSVPKSLDQVIDANLLYPHTENSDKILECISRILEMALKCSADSPGNRTNMKEVVAELQKIKGRFLA